MPLVGNDCWDAMKAAIDALPPSSQSDPVASGRAMMTAFFTYLHANAGVTVKIVAGDAGLQRDADGANPDTLGPSGTKTLATLGTIA
jgi:hypothetical protein